MFFNFHMVLKIALKVHVTVHMYICIYRYTHMCVYVYYVWMYCSYNMRFGKFGIICMHS